jgi:RNA polymerase sigma-70 factor (ECF subfamily)
MLFIALTPHSATAEQFAAGGSHMVFENLAISSGKRKSCSMVPESQEYRDTNLVEAAKAGHSSAFATLCERYAQQLLRAAYRITRNREDSEDAVQDALLRAFVHLRDFNGESTFATWVTRIAINSALMILRKKRSSLEMAITSGDNPGSDSFIQQIADQAPNPERRYAQREKERILKKAIHSLRPTLRQVIEMKQLEERSMRETAETMCISVAAAKARLFHAKLALRKSSILKLMHQSRSRGKFRGLSAA